jgi:hypothetical protein
MWYCFVITYVLTDIIISVYNQLLCWRPLSIHLLHDTQEDAENKYEPFCPELISTSLPHLIHATILGWRINRSRVQQNYNKRSKYISDVNGTRTHDPSVRSYSPAQCSLQCWVAKCHCQASYSHRSPNSAPATFAFSHVMIRTKESKLQRNTGLGISARVSQNVLRAGGNV